MNGKLAKTAEITIMKLTQRITKSDCVISYFQLSKPNSVVIVVDNALY
jgi:hypothetical protein